MKCASIVKKNNKKTNEIVVLIATAKGAKPRYT